LKFLGFAHFHDSAKSDGRPYLTRKAVDLDDVTKPFVVGIRSDVLDTCFVPVEQISQQGASLAELAGHRLLRRQKVLDLVIRHVVRIDRIPGAA